MRKLIPLTLSVLILGIGFSISVSAEEELIPSWIKNTAKFWSDGQVSDAEFLNALQFLVKENILVITPEEKTLEANCSGNAGCIPGIVTKIIDGDTIKIYGKSIRFSLSATPEMHEAGGIEARDFIEDICPVGSPALVDEDDMQTEGSHGRIIGVIHCNNVNLNEKVLEAGYGEISTHFCSKSEFSNEAWAKKYGC